MEILINNQKEDIPERATIDRLLAFLRMDNPKGLAVAVNKKVVSRGSWASTPLKDGDEVLLIQASQGG